MTTTAKGIPELGTSAFIKDGPTDINAALSAIDALFDTFVPSGTVFATARSSAPSGFILCDGSAISRTTYATLFTAIGTTYGTGNGTTTFNVPDLRGRVPVGVDGAAARLAANDALGNSGGEEKHTLTAAETASHTHGVAVNAITTNAGPADAYVIGERKNSASTLPGSPVSTTNFGSAGVGTTFTAAPSTDQAHNNMQPFQVVNWMVKL